MVVFVQAAAVVVASKLVSGTLDEIQAQNVY